MIANECAFIILKCNISKIRLFSCEVLLEGFKCAGYGRRARGMNWFFGRLIMWPIFIWLIILFMHFYMLLGLCEEIELFNDQRQSHVLLLLLGTIILIAFQSTIRYANI